MLTKAPSGYQYNGKNRSTTTRNNSYTRLRKGIRYQGGDPCGMLSWKVVLRQRIIHHGQLHRATTVIRASGKAFGTVAETHVGCYLVKSSSGKGLFIMPNYIEKQQLYAPPERHSVPGRRPMWDAILESRPPAKDFSSWPTTSAPSTRAPPAPDSSSSTTPAASFPSPRRNTSRSIPSPGGWSTMPMRSGAAVAK